MAFRSINSRTYNKVRVDNGKIIDVIEIVGEMACKSQMLTGMCEIKCEGNVWIDERGRRFCPHPHGIAYVRKV